MSKYHTKALAETKKIAHEYQHNKCLLTSKIGTLRKVELGQFFSAALDRKGMREYFLCQCKRLSRNEENGQ